MEGKDAIEDRPTPVKSREYLKEQKLPTLREFTQNTTFHGVKYVFDDTPWFRKLFWAMVILGSLAFFVVQVGMRINDYYKYQTVTSVKRVTSDILPFPAVTLCNLNQFRISQAFDMGLYEYIDQQLQTQEILNNDAVANVANTSETIRSLGHQLEQLVDSCEWQGRPCNIETEFLTRLLDIGLCHTFNFDENNRKQVNQPGVEGGLKLIMNIEDFEHMRSSNLDSGVKFLLHEPGERPSLRNLGFVVTSGQHTFVTIKHGEMHSLPDPWGECIENGEAVADCKYRCFSEDFIQHCNCSDSSMEPNSTYQECDLSLELTCGCNGNFQDSSTCGLKCTCPVPCKEYIYRPTLSSSGLSSTNIDMFVLKGEGVYNKTRNAFLKASETRLRLSNSFISDYITPADTIVMTYSKIQEINTHYNYSKNDSYMALLVPFGENFYRSTSSYDPKLLLDNIKDGLGGTTCGTEMEEAAELLDVAVNLLHIMQIEFEHLNSEPDNCMSSTAYQEMMAVWNVFYSDGWNLDSGCYSRNMKCQELQHMISIRGCNPWMSRCILCHIGHLHRILLDPETSHLRYSIRDKGFNDQMIHYTFTIYESIKWNRGSYNVTYDEECKIISDFVIEDENLFPVLFDNVENLDPAHFDDETSFGITNLTMDVLFDFVNSTYSELSDPFLNASHYILVKKFSDVCCWQHRLLNYEYEMQFYNGTHYHDLFVLAQKKTFDQAVYRYQSMSISELVSGLNDLLLSSLEKSLLPLAPKMKLLTKYTNKGNYSTPDLIVDYYEPAGIRHMASVITETEREIEGLIKVQKILNKVIEHLEEYTYLIQQGMFIPLIAGARNVDHTQRIQFLKNPSTAAAYEKFATPKCKNFTFTKANSDEILHYHKIACSMSELITKDIEQISKAVNEFELNFDSLLRTLAEYYESIQMKENFYMKNFMQVDLYYETLQYEVTEEQEAFVIGSLFSEVGGFLGLLLGASVLTMLEIIDYILLVIGQKMKKFRAVASFRQDQEMVKCHPNTVHK